jgi:hypothetical protein
VKHGRQLRVRVLQPPAGRRGRRRFDGKGRGSRHITSHEIILQHEACLGPVHPPSGSLFLDEPPHRNLLAADEGGAHCLDDVVDDLLGQLDDRKPVSNLNRADLLAGDAGLARDRAD